MANEEASKNALIRQIERAERDLIDQRATGSTSEDGMAVLFTGNFHDSVPRQLIISGDLTAIEKVTWQVIRLTIHDPARPGSTPRREELAAMINCSPPTVTTSRMMLRVSRWMTYCKTVRQQGRFVGDIYLLHSEPLSVAVTLQLDPAYIDFLRSQLQSSSKRMRSAAASALKDVESLTTEKPATEVDGFIGRIARAREDKERVESAQTSSTKDSLGLSAGTAHQSKNFALVKSTSLAPRSTETLRAVQNSIQSKNFAVVENDQSKNFATVDFDQSKNFAPAEKNFLPSRGSFSSSSRFISKYITAHTRDSEATNQADVGTAFRPEQLLDKDVYRRLTDFEDINAYGFDGLAEDTLEKLLEEVSPLLRTSSALLYATHLFAGKASSLAAVSQKLRRLPLGTREMIMFQLLGRTAAWVHGWTDRRVNDPIAYADNLVKKALKGELIPDDHALELRRSAEAGCEANFGVEVRSPT